MTLRPENKSINRFAKKHRILLCVGVFIFALCFLLMTPILKMGLKQYLSQNGYPNAKIHALNLGMTQAALNISLSPNIHIKDLKLSYDLKAITINKATVFYSKNTSQIMQLLTNINFNTLTINQMTLNGIEVQGDIYKKNQSLKLTSTAHIQGKATKITAKITGTYNQTTLDGHYLVEFQRGKFNIPFLISGKRLTGWLSGTYKKDTGFKHTGEIGFGSLKPFNLHLRSVTLTYQDQALTRQMILRGVTQKTGTSFLLDITSDKKIQTDYGLFDLHFKDMRKALQTSFTLQRRQGLIKVSFLSDLDNPD